jgi:subtilisin family serine protease
MEKQTTGRNALRACIGILTAGVAASAAPAFADAPIIRAENQIEGQYIVVFEEGSNVSAMMEKMAAWSGATPMMEYGTVLTGGAFKMNASQARLAANMPGVAYIEEDQQVFLADADVNLAAVDQARPLSYGLDQLTPGPGYRTDFDGDGVTIYVMDTGASKAQNNVGYDTARVVSDLIGDGQNGGDCNGHGTAVSGTALGNVTGVAPASDLAIIRVFSCTGTTSNTIIIGGFEAAGRDFMSGRAGDDAVLNGSFSGGASPASDQAANRLSDMGVVTVIAAGNDNRDACLNSPARATNVLTVGSNDSQFQRSGFSNDGRCVEIFAAGTAITTLNNPSGMRQISGTSFASPTAAGVVALVLQEARAAGRDLTPAQAIQRTLQLARRNAIRGSTTPGAPLAQVPGAK